MKLFAIMMMAALALGGCETQTPGQRAWVACQALTNYAEWGACYDRYLTRAEARQAREAARSQARDDAFDDAVAAGIMINYATRPRSCMNIGGIVTC